MNIGDQILRLTEQHKRLDESTNKLEKEAEKYPDNADLQSKLKDLKKKKLTVRDELALLHKQEYEQLQLFEFEDYDR